jgi:nucleoside-diphosphate-sugar epimerase
VASLRIFNAYGERNDKGVIFKFFSSVKSNKPITVHGDGEYVRDYVYVKDIVRVIKKLIENELEPGTYEVGSGVGTSVNGLVEIMEKLVGKKVKVKHEPGGYDIIKFSVASKTVVENPTKLEAGLKEVWKSFA